MGAGLQHPAGLGDIQSIESGHVEPTTRKPHTEPRKSNAVNQIRTHASETQFFSPLSLILFFVLLLGITPSALLADAGLVIENPDGAFGFLTDAGHASVWISHGCLDEHGRAYFCEGSPGIILTGTGYWRRPGAAAIPADLYFVGPSAVPVPDPARTWSQVLGAAYPDISPQIGRKYIGRLWRRNVRVLVFPTTAEEDRRVIETAQRERSDFRFSFYTKTAPPTPNTSLSSTGGRSRCVAG